MNRTEIIAKLKSTEPALRAHGIAGLYLFGSYARDAALADSDVDLFVDKEPTRTFGFDELMGGYKAVHRVLGGVDVSFGTREGLSPYIRNAVEREAIRIF